MTLPQPELPTRTKLARRAYRRGGPRVQPPKVAANPDGSLPPGAIRRQTFDAMSLHEQLHHYRSGGAVVD